LTVDVSTKSDAKSLNIQLFWFIFELRVKLMEKNYIDLGSSILYRCNQKYYDKLLSDYGLGYSQFVFLSSIYQAEGIQMNELAANGSFDKGSITKAIAKLEEMDYVRVENSEDDKRTKKWYTTKKTRDLMPKLYQLRQEWVNYLLQDLNDEERRDYFALMNKILSKATEYSTYEVDDEDIKFYGIQKLTLLDFPGNMAATVFTGGCNFRCPFCHNKQLVFLNHNETEISKQEILDYLNDRKKILDGVAITGGEPLLQPGIQSFLKDVRKIGMKIKLDTNGTFFEKLKEIVEEGLVDYVAMDIKNEKSKYSETIGLENFNIKNVEKSVEYLMHQDKVDYEFRTTVTKEYHENTNFKKIGEWIQGAKHYYLQNFEDHGSCIKEGLHPVEKEQLIKMKEVIKPFIPNVEIRGIDEGEN